jgi:hypothetical protein
LLACLCVLPGPAAAHFNLNSNIRIFHIEHLDGGLRVYLRLPTPYVLAGLLGPEDADGIPAPAPYSSNRMEGSQLQHILDLEAFAKDPIGLGRLVAAGHKLSVDGAAVVPTVEAVRLYPAAGQPRFASIEEARAAFENPLFPPEIEDLYIGDTVLDVLLSYDTGGQVSDLKLSNSLNPGLAGQEATANLIIDHAPGGSKVFRAFGLMADPVTIRRSALAAAWTFIKEGIGHILEGADHVLFVVCLALGATTIAGLLWRVTGFTIGHSISLAAGFFGFVPSGAWFISAVEIGIALSIIYAAVIALTRREGVSTFVVTSLIGLLHGFGFSFVLGKILSTTGADVWQSLLAFNVGVEIGQVAIILLVWPLFILTRTRNPRLWPTLRLTVALPAIAVASLWAGQRALTLIEGLPSS